MKSFIGRVAAILMLVLGLSGVQQNVVAQKKLPCDIFKDCGTPCVAAHSVVRALYSSYNGPLYQISSGSKEAEAATRSGTAAVATNNKNYTGTGFVQGFANSTTAQVQFTITAPSAGQYSVLVRYSAGSGAASNIGIFVNGTQIPAVSFPATSAWTEWSIVTHTVTLNAGSNTIAYKAVTSSATSINLDNISIPAIDKKDIYPLTPGGYANAAVVDSFSKGKAGVTVSKIYDQSERKNDLTVSLWGSAKTSPLNETPATRFKDTISGNIVYPLYTLSGEGYRNNHTNGVATGAQPEGMYVVASGKHTKNGCCWDYGNAESDAEAGGKKTGVMEALYFGNTCWFAPCNGNGPWMFADLEWGLFQGWPVNDPKTTNTSLPYDYVSGFLKGDVRTYTIRAADATAATLKLMGTTNRPAPNILTGAIILGIGGDSAPSGAGIFFEGAMTIGRPPDSAEDAVQRNLSLVYSGRDTIKTGIFVADETPAASPINVRYNPSTGSAVISYALQEAGRVSMSIFDQQGRLVTMIAQGIVPAGRRAVTWNARQVPAGVYIWRMRIDGRDGGAGNVIIGK